MELILAAGAVGLAGYALGKRKERHEIANGFVTYHGNATGQPEYGNVHYGSSARHYHGGSSGGHRSHHHTYYPTGTGGTTQY
ncbi:unnamed protein product [Adineta ricciae]|uniref:Uncharacterized protein n=1 Tax=Adineta ricciae TaxID=249248 RepID=A0A814VW91_ADIRI|nr:unnamed protein product [Adineta ricciae]